MYSPLSARAGTIWLGGKSLKSSLFTILITCALSSEDSWWLGVGRTASARPSHFTSPACVQRWLVRTLIPSSSQALFFRAPFFTVSLISSMALLRSETLINRPRLPPRSHWLFFLTPRVLQFQLRLSLYASTVS